MNLCSDSSRTRGVIPGSFRGHSGVIPGSFWDHSRIMSGSFRGHSGVIPGSFRGYSEVFPGSFWDHSGVIPGSFRGHSGIIPGSFQQMLGVRCSMLECWMFDVMFGQIYVLFCSVFGYHVLVFGDVFDPNVCSCWANGVRHQPCLNCPGLHNSIEVSFFSGGV